MTIHPIEIESYRRMRAAIDFSSWPDRDRDVVERMVHATADVEYAETAFVGADVVSSTTEALRNGAAVVTDAHMVRIGLVGVAEVAGVQPVCHLDDVGPATADLTRSAAAIRFGAQRHPVGAVFVIGNAPTALFELLALCRAGTVKPASIIGLPVGFVGATESKQELLDSAWRSICVTNHGRKGGSAVAAASMNAVVRLCRQDQL